MCVDADEPLVGLAISVEDADNLCERESPLLVPPVMYVILPMLETPEGVSLSVLAHSNLTEGRVLQLVLAICRTPADLRCQNFARFRTGRASLLGRAWFSWRNRSLPVVFLACAVLGQVE